MTIDHKAAFRETNYGKRWHEAVAETWFQEGVKTALLTFQMPTALNTEAAACNWNRAEGARMFALHLLNLTEPPHVRQPDTTGNLKHIA